MKINFYKIVFERIYQAFKYGHYHAMGDELKEDGSITALVFHSVLLSVNILSIQTFLITLFSFDSLRPPKYENDWIIDVLFMILIMIINYFYLYKNGRCISIINEIEQREKRLRRRYTLFTVLYVLFTFGFFILSLYSMDYFGVYI